MNMGIKSKDSQASWLPMIIVSMGQTLTALNINALPVSIGGIVGEFNVAPTTVGTVIVVYSLAVAGFIMLGAKLGQKFGSTLVFRWASGFLLLASVFMTFSPSITVMFIAQFLAGLGAAMIGPTFVVQIAHNYTGKQQARALGILGGVSAVASAAAFFVAGIVGTTLGWRYAFGFVIVFALLTLFMSFRLKHTPKAENISIDALGAVLAVTTISLLSLGFNNINDWGLFFANAAAPIAPLGISPAILMIFAGVIGIQLFIAWAQRRQAAQLTPLLALDVLESQAERMAIISLLAIVAVGNALSFLVPMYIQMVQGRSSMDTAIALIPYQMAILTSAMLVINLYDRFSPRRIARYAFAIVAFALTLLAVVMDNEWSNGLVVLGLILVGLGQGALITLLFNVLVTSSPKELAGDVGALRGAINNLSNGLGTALAAALLVGVLSVTIHREVTDHPLIPPALIEQVNLDRTTFVSNERLIEVMNKTSATPEQVNEAMRINADARLHALHVAFLFFAGLALLMVVPARRLPGPQRHTARTENQLQRPRRRLSKKIS
jgi:MFS family permease